MSKEYYTAKDLMDIYGIKPHELRRNADKLTVKSKTINGSYTLIYKNDAGLNEVIKKIESSRIKNQRFKNCTPVGANIGKIWSEYRKESFNSWKELLSDKHCSLSRYLSNARGH